MKNVRQLHAIMGLKNKLLFIFFIVSSIGCRIDSAKQPKMPLMISPFEYNLDRPFSAVKLPRELKEISGMTLYNTDKLLAIQDEEGMIYVVSLHDGSILHSADFGSDADYEGIAMVGKDIYILRSDGEITVVEGSPEEENSLNLSSINTLLDSTHNTEGICYDPFSESLLIACKDKGEGNTEAVRHIYRMEPKSKDLNEVPAFTIDIESIKSYLDKVETNEDIRAFREIAEESPDELFIHPSDIAVHPKTGDIYISSAKRINCLLVISKEGKIKSLVRIPRQLLEQPEGICFTPNGDLLISTEGKPKKDRLFLFHWNKE